MPSLSLASGIENIENRDEARVLALIDHLMPSLPDWRKGEDLRAEDNKRQEELAGLSERRDSISSTLVALRPQVTKTQLQFKTLLAAAGIAIALGVVLGFLFKAYFFILGLAVAGYPVFNASKLKKALAHLQQNQLTEERAAAEAATSIKQVKDRRTAIRHELADRMTGFPEVTLGHVRFPLDARAFVGQNILLDASASHPSTALHAVDMSRLINEAGDVDQRLRKLRSIPPLLSPHSSDPVDDPMNQLYGEENTLQDLVSDFTANLGKLTDVNLQMPMIPASSLLAQRLQRSELAPATAERAFEVRSTIDNSKQIDEFLSVLGSNQGGGAAMIQNLEYVHQELADCCKRFATARIQAVNTIHVGLIQVLNRATWVSRKFFCPRTVLSPQYLQDLIGVHVTDAHTLDLNVLLDRLQSDQVIRDRIAKKPELLDLLNAVYVSVHECIDIGAHDENGQPLQQNNRSRYVDQQLKESLHQFKSVLNRILTGAAFPILNFSNEANLTYDPDTDLWTSDLSPYEYTTPDVLKYGSTIRAHHELMIPLWEHLWTEKADFRKSEVFRTNEAMIRMSEKESEKLIEIGNQFRGDLRTSRENIYIIEADLSSKYDEIVAFRDGLDKLQLLSERAKAQLGDDRLRDLIVSESPLGVAARYETTLSGLPQVQAEARGTVTDPIEIVREPGILLSYSGQQSFRLLAR